MLYAAKQVLAFLNLPSFNFVKELSLDAIPISELLTSILLINVLDFSPTDIPLSPHFFI